MGKYITEYRAPRQPWFWEPAFIRACYEGRYLDLREIIEQRTDEKMFWSIALALAYINENNEKLLLLEKHTVIQLINKLPLSLLQCSKFHYRVHNSPLLNPVLSQINPVHTLSPYSVIL
jgi:hypothetical protein